MCALHFFTLLPYNLCVHAHSFHVTLMLSTIHKENYDNIITTKMSITTIITKHNKVRSQKCDDDNNDKLSKLQSTITKVTVYVVKIRESDTTLKRCINYIKLLAVA